MEPDRSAPFAIVAFPSLEPGDKQWIESIRARHDPQVGKIAAHFTLVFPTVLSLRTIEAQVLRVARGIEPIRFVLRRAGVVPDAVGEGGHVFLIPEEGRDQITQLHDRLYDGALQSHLRKDVSFTPHLTLAARPSLEPLHTLAGEINATSRGVRGFIADVALVEVTQAAVHPVARFQLGPS
jgi:2'-5' RNA ligase